MRSAAHARRLRQVLRRAAVLAVPMLLGGLLLPAAVPAARAATCGPTNLALNQPTAGSSPASAGRPPAPAPLAAQVTIASPGGLESRRGVPARLQIKGSAGLTYRATGLPPGLAISPAGLITGTGETPGTRTVTVTGTSASGGTAATTFVWTISRSSS
jgi:hypothetical protein